MTITREIKGTRIVCKLYDNEADEMTEGIIHLSGDYSGDTKSPKLRDACRKYYKKNPTYTFLSVKSVTLEKGLYALDEETFLKYATRIGDGR